jgi:hypothetical protein
LGRSWWVTWVVFSSVVGEHIASAEEAQMASEIIPTTIAVHKYLKQIGAYKRVQNFLLRRTAYPVLVVGATGVGKTSLVRSLFGDTPTIDREDRTDSVKAVSAQLEKKLFIKLIDTPGEIQHEAKRMAAFRQAMKYKSIGIINVVSYGFHEGKFSKASALQTDVIPSKTFLNRRREVERKLLKEWVGLLCGKEAPADWVLTIVTKADLWWENLTEQSVIRFYEGNPYISALKEAAELPHSVKPYCSTRHLFFDTVPMSGYYSDQKATDHHTAVISHILDKASEYG